jgi:hypothetical protein
MHIPKVKYFMSLIEENASMNMGDPPFNISTVIRSHEWCCAIEFELDSNFLILAENSLYPWQNEVLIGPNVYTLTGVSRKVLRCENDPFKSIGIYSNYSNVRVTIFHLKQLRPITSLPDLN